MRNTVAIIGGGAAGMMAALTAAGNGNKVTIYEHTDRLGKKILSTGNGKCNLGNRYMTKDCFYSSNQELVEKCLERFSTKDTIDFFESIGLCIKEKNGYLYPLAEQAAVVLDVLRFAIESNGIEVIYNSNVKHVYQVVNSCGDSCLCVDNAGKQRFFQRVILACGSKAAPKTGSDGSGYDLVKELGHKLQPVLPSLVQLRCNDNFCKALSGIRNEARIHIFDGEKLLCSEQGELQLTDYGISGIPIFQLSGLVNRYMYEKGRKKAKGDIKNDLQLVAKIDFLPDIAEETFEKIMDRRFDMVSDYPQLTVETLFTGYLNKKLMQVLIKEAGLHPSQLVADVKKDKIFRVFELSRGLRMHITGSNGFDNAQVCTGGVDMRDVTENLESKLVSGVYFAGELLDVDGRCGGYNLQWAWTSGYITGSI